MLTADEKARIGLAYLQWHNPPSGRYVPNGSSVADDSQARRAEPLPPTRVSRLDGSTVPITLDGFYDITGQRARLTDPVDPSHVVS